MIIESIRQEVVKHLSTTEQLQFAVAAEWDAAQIEAVFGSGSVVARVKALVDGGQLATHGTAEVFGVPSLVKAIEDGRSGKPRLALQHLHGGRAADKQRIEAMRVGKAAVPAATTANNSALYSPTQAAGVLLPPVTVSLIQLLSRGGAANLPPNTRLLTQTALLTAAEVAEGAAIPAAAPDIDFRLTTTNRKFALIVAFTAEMMHAGNFDNPVQEYVEQQLTDAASNATDLFFVNLMLSEGTDAGADVVAAMRQFEGDLRSAVWIANPDVLTTLQDAANPNVGPAGGTYRTLPALPTMAAPDNTLFLVDRKRVAVFDGPMLIDSTIQADIVMDTAPGSENSAPVSMFQKNLKALKVTKYADAKLLTKPLVITLS
ncbi:hypothetical protein [Paraburkholderia humisilvae]|uniref:Uncharacterized protein n=1 Tax=Paraburkholderia humisilvae TaxID=627669 RepID=A0A6J5CZP3_9BURK|nr:hypothetical protein [Paraburkholderia humisilvae]CAB3746432.1 hypothetical protein LMG29542_00209 [Paraburkholderia humisilvae]